MVFLRAGRHVVQIPYEEFERWVREGRVHKRVEVHFEPVTGDRWVPAGELELYRSLVDDESARFHRQFSLRQFPWITFIFVIACVAYWAIISVEMVQRGATVVQLLQNPRFDLLVKLGAKEGGNMLELGQWWRLLTFSFLHAGLIHLVPNMLYTAYVGWNVEAVYGRSGAVVIYLFSAVGCGFVSLLASTIPSVGASGVTFGLFAAAVVFGWKYEPLIPPGYTKKFGWAFFPFLAMFLVMGFRSPLVDNWGHVGGVIGGGLAAFLLVPAVVQSEVDRQDAARRRGYLVAITAALVIFGMPYLVGPVGLLRFPRLDLAVVHDFAGLSFSLPRYWAQPPVYDAFPYDAYTSPSNAIAISYGVQVQEYPVRTDDSAALLLDEIQNVPGYEPIYDTLREEERLVGSEIWRVITVTVQEGQKERVYQRAVTSRGCVEFRLTFQNRLESFAEYRVLRDRILQTVQLTEPRSIREGRENLRIYPDLWKLHSDLGRSYAVYGETELAESELLRAREMDARRDEPLFWLLFLYDRYDLEAGRRRQLLEESLSEFPSNGDLLMLCVEACRGLGDRRCEGRALALAHRAYPRHPKIQGFVEDFGGVKALPPLPTESETGDDGPDRAGDDEEPAGGARGKEPLDPAAERIGRIAP